MKKLSIGIPCYNEEKNIELMYQAVTEQMKKVPQYDYEIVFGDNASEDGSEEILRRIASKDNRVKVIFNQANFGPAANGYNIQRSQTGDAFINIPCDFQEPPEMIPEFVSYWEQGFQIVWGQKTKSKENKLKYLLRGLFYKIIRFFSDEPQLEQVTCFGIIDKTVYNVMLPYLLKNKDMSMRFLALKYGFHLKLIPYTQNKRRFGRSSFNFSSYFQYALTALCNTSIKPLRIMTGMGFAVAAVSFLWGIVYFVMKLLMWNRFRAGMIPVIILLAFSSAVQMMCLGLLGEYIGIIMGRVTSMPLVVEKDRLNFEEREVRPDAQDEGVH